jgi:hypothetical protein
MKMLFALVVALSFVGAAIACSNSTPHNCEIMA